MHQIPYVVSTWRRGRRPVIRPIKASPTTIPATACMPEETGYFKFHVQRRERCSQASECRNRCDNKAQYDTTIMTSIAGRKGGLTMYDYCTFLMESLDTANTSILVHIVDKCYENSLSSTRDLDKVVPYRDKILSESSRFTRGISNQKFGIHHIHFLLTVIYL